MSGLRGATSIVGAGTFGLGEAPGLSELEITAGAVKAALDDAGLRPADIDGVFCASMTYNMGSLTLCEYLGISPKFSDSSMIGGSSNLAHLLTAMMAIATGQCDVALVAYGSNQRSVSGRLVSTSRPDPYESPYGPRQPITSYALAASRHMHQYGTTREQLAEVATAARAWATLNPDAFMREPLSIQDVLAARPVSDPFTVRDCCLVTDGGGAVILTSTERARDLKRPPVPVLGRRDGPLAPGHHQHAGPDGHGSERIRTACLRDGRCLGGRYRPRRGVPTPSPSTRSCFSRISGSAQRARAVPSWRTARSLPAAGLP